MSNQELCPSCRETGVCIFLQVIERNAKGGIPPEKMSVMIAQARSEVRDECCCPNVNSEFIFEGREKL